MNPSHRITQLGAYIMAELNQAAKKHEAKTGQSVLTLSQGNPDFPVAPEVQEKLRELSLDAANFRYPGYAMIPQFKEAVSSYYQRRFNVDLSDCAFVPLMGAKDAVSHINLALLDEGDEVLVPDPGYSTYTNGARLVGAVPVPYSLEAFLEDPHSVKEKINSKTRAIWMNFPNNPTGAMIELSIYQSVVDLALKYGLAVLSDNPYVDITFGEKKAPSILQAKGADEVAIEMMSMSKDFSLAGVRVGYAVGQPEIINALSSAKSQMDSGMCLLHQKLAAFCLDQMEEEWAQAWASKRNEYYKNKRDELSAFLEETLGVQIERPEGAMYLWFKIPSEFKKSRDYAEYVLKEHSILLVPGIAYGQEGDGYVRASFAAFEL